MKPMEIGVNKKVYDRVPSEIMFLKRRCTKEHWFSGDKKSEGVL
ncbi:hypothetical protein [Flavobacterium granuli]|nr:hypothetical protein [Flavobacterium granuli]